MSRWTPIEGAIACAAAVLPLVPHAERDVAAGVVAAGVAALVGWPPGAVDLAEGYARLYVEGIREADRAGARALLAIAELAGLLVGVESADPWTVVRLARIAASHDVRGRRGPAACLLPPK